MPRVKKRDFEDQGDTSSSKKRSKNGSRGRKGAATFVEEEIPEALIEQIKLKSNPYCGVLLFSGGTNWDMIGRSRPPKNMSTAPKPLQGGPNLGGPRRLGSLNGIRVRGVFSGPVSCHSVIVTEEGKAYSWGRNCNEQLGHGDAIRRDEPTLIEDLKQYCIVNAATGRNHTLCLTETGTVFSFGDNKMGQLGLGHQTASVGIPCKLLYKGQPIVKVACGGEFSMILDCKGTLHSFGHPEYSQLGHNSTGQYFVTSSKLTFDCILTPRKIPLFIAKSGRETTAVPNVVIKDVKCGTNHTVAMDMQGRVFTWGFGGYGRLGHSGPKDEPVPCSVKIFDMPQRGSLMLWGQTKRTGEAMMYPKPIQDLAGWAIRDVGCGQTSIIVAADESIVAWGPSPTYGELCYGDNSSIKSSTRPTEAKPCIGVYFHTVAMGMGHSLLIARDESEEDIKKIEAFPWFGPVREIPESEILEKQRKAEGGDNDEEKEESEEEMEDEEEDAPVEDVTPSSAAAAAAASAAKRAAEAAEDDESPTLVPFQVKEQSEQKSVEKDEEKDDEEKSVENDDEKVEAKTEDEETKSESTKSEPVKAAAPVASETAPPVNGSAKEDEPTTEATIPTQQTAAPTS